MKKMLMLAPRERPECSLGTLAMPWRLFAVSWTTATGRRSVSRVKPLFLASLWNAGLEVAMLVMRLVSPLQAGA